MKKIVLTLTTMAFMAAQGMNFGLNVGLTGATYDATGAASDLIDPGFSLGLMTGFDVAFADLDIEANFSFYKFKDLDDSGLIFMSIPATVRFSVLPLPVANIFVRGGVAYEKTLVAKLIDDEDADFADDTDAGIAWIIGVGAKVEIPKVPSILAELRFSLPQYDWIKDNDGKLSRVAFQATILF